MFSIGCDAIRYWDDTRKLIQRKGKVVVLRCYPVLRWYRKTDSEKRKSGCIEYLAASSVTKIFEESLLDWRSLKAFKFFTLISVLQSSSSFISRLWSLPNNFWRFLKHFTSTRSSRRFPLLVWLTFEYQSAHPLGFELIKVAWNHRFINDISPHPNNKSFTLFLDIVLMQFLVRRSCEIHASSWFN